MMKPMEQEEAVRANEQPTSPRKTLRVSFDSQISHVMIDIASADRD